MSAPPLPAPAKVLYTAGDKPTHAKDWLDMSGSTKEEFWTREQMRAYGDAYRKPANEHASITQSAPELEHSPVDKRCATFFSRLIDQLIHPPRPGTLAADLTEREKMSVIINAGVPYAVDREDNMVTIKAAVPCAIADRGDGGYIVCSQKDSQVKSMWAEE